METLVALGLLLMSTLLLGGFFISYSRQYKRYEARQDLILLAEKSMLRIQALLGDTRSSLVTLDATTNGLYFPNAEGAQGSLRFDSAGALSWQSWVSFGWDTTTRVLWEGSQALTSTSVAPLASGWKKRTLARWVSLFEISGPVNKARRVRILVQDDQSYQAEFISTVVAQN